MVQFNGSDLKSVMAALQEERKLFYSENDFRFALAWKIKEIYKTADVRLEYCSNPNNDKKIYIDIVVILDGKYYPIELKYKTKALSVNLGDEKYFLKNQAAHNFSRYYYLKDFQRIESLIKSGFCENGFAIMLTNDYLYWESDCKGDVDQAFSLHENNEKKGKLCWGKNVGEKVKKEKTEFKLNGKYTIKWNDYSNINDVKNGKVRYCLNEIKL